MSQTPHPKVFSPNPAVNDTIHRLLALGCPPIPVAPKQDSRKPWCHRVAKTKDGFQFCPVDKHLNPIPKFTGKNPSYLKRDGSPWLCLHGEYQSRLPTPQELKKFFCHPDTGVGTLGGHAGVVWIDFDKKCYESPEECDLDVQAFIARNGLGATWIERTGSGGWRVAVKVTSKPCFTNFASDQAGGKHRGEALFEGRFTVLSPTIHPNGKPYLRTGWGEPIEVEGLEQLGLFPAQDEVEQQTARERQKRQKQANPDYGKPSDPDSPWDIRHFASYFDGYAEAGGWGAAQCPHHANATSFTSFRVNLATGAYKLWCGCACKDVWQSGLKLAIARGYKPPEPKELFGGYSHEPTEGISEQEIDRIYRELTQLTATPWKEIDTPKLDLKSLGLELGAIYIVSSAKGTHKTNSLVQITPKFDNIYAWFNRIALGREECNRIGVTWKDDLKAFTGSLKAGFCADSSYSFPPGHLKNNGLLLGDEADQVFEHMFGTTCNKDGKRPMILAALKAQLDSVIAGNGIALFMSADITDKEVEYIQKLAPPGCPVRLIVNKYKPPLGDVYFYESDTPDGMVEQLLQDLEDGNPRFVIDDMRTGIRGCKSIAEYIRSVHPEWAAEIVEINSDTSGDPTIIQYLKNINTASQTTRLLCCSPSVVSGISIENGHFTEVYGFYNGIMTVSHASQSLARVRGADIINVWAAEKGLIYTADRSFSPKEIKSYFKRNYESNAKHILAFGVQYCPLKDEWDSPHFDLYCKYAAYRNCCMEDLRIRLHERLTSEGYQIFRVAAGPSDMVKEGLKSAWSHLEISHAHAVDAASILTDAELQALENITQSPDQKLDVEKTYLLKSFGQELIDNMVFEHEESGQVLTGFAAMVLKDRRGEYRKQLDAFYLLTADVEIAITKDVKASQRQLDQGAGRFAGDVRWNTRQRKAREFLGLPKFLDPSAWWGPADLADLAQKSKKYFGRVKDALGFTVEKMTAGQIFGELMSQMGLDLLKKWGPGLTVTGRRYKLRQLDPDSWRYAQMYVKYRESLLQQSANPQPENKTAVCDHPSLTYLSKTVGGGEQGQTHTQHSVEVIPVPQVSAPDLEVRAPLASTQSTDQPTILSDHPPGIYLSETIGGGDQGLSHTQQGIELVSSSGFSSGDLSQQQVTSSGTEGALVSCWRFGRMFQFRVERFIDTTMAQIRSILTGEVFQVPVSQLAPWSGAA